MAWASTAAGRREGGRGVRGRVGGNRKGKNKQIRGFAEEVEDEVVVVVVQE
jgi:hypothetical protein